MLTVRYDYTNNIKPVILDSNLEISLTSKIINQKPIIFCSNDSSFDDLKIKKLRFLNCVIIQVALNDNKLLDLYQIIKILSEMGYKSLMVNYLIKGGRWGYCY